MKKAFTYLNYYFDSYWVTCHSNAIIKIYICASVSIFTLKTGYFSIGIKFQTDSTVKPTHLKL